ncbi:winged helix-turn-helix transcriptional regulator [Candidatus Woesearchaeota archaeon]|nr:winged helix-turn-helix transcriptional regulator [Candidatus Woesearchaeota archaeon]
MTKNNFLLVDLNEAKTKKLAETITSDTSRKILNHLTEKESTESVIAKELNLPLPTVHYHLQKLQEAGLVIVEEFHYSQKGREVNHYKLANKYIIIAPKKVMGLKQKLKGILPVGLIVLGISAVWGFLTGTTTFANKTIAMDSVAMIPTLEQNIVMIQPPVYADQYSVLWFLAGGLFTLLMYVLIIVMQEKSLRR